jgi:histidine triad (HIT) family protein
VTPTPEETSTACDFCAIVRGDAQARVIWSDSDLLAFFPLNPATMGHVLLIPKAHFCDIWDLPNNLSAKLWLATKPLADALRDAFEPDGLNLIQSSGEAASQSVFHFHLHLVPRWTSDPMGDLWPPKRDYPTRELDSAQEKLKTALRAQA